MIVLWRLFSQTASIKDIIGKFFNNVVDEADG